ncbi:hypothetical protein LS684_06730 [Cytobacillus spongiae]|jgi:hypothetical protein|uniref:hypothetical protein n=1 Tax=Cytobacillus spongiae TaxID=2901381 RepID=UPI001F2C99CF|nr:hypothetical protein [Cytobacillus spongiae]UII57131.1 hypothetical protein LS684_06730 [Cytobacillus spongiae]
MPRKSSEELEEMGNRNTDNEISKLNRFLGVVMEYISDDEIEEIDVEHLLDRTEGLRDWWNQYLEKNRVQLEEGIKNALSELSIEELQLIKDQIKQYEEKVKG